MTENKFKIDKDVFRENLIKYTKKAFQMLPELDNPRILDIGCGSGVPAIELARLCNGQITGIDCNQSLLDIFTQKIKEAGLSDRVCALNCSLFELNFPDEHFDIVWSEGSIFVIGFRKGLKAWRRFIKSNGFLVVHDEATNIAEKRRHISECGYHLIGDFMLSEDMWWKEYFNPLKKYLHEVREKCSDPAVLSACDTEQKEIDMFKKDSRNGSIFFIMQKETEQGLRPFDK